LQAAVAYARRQGLQFVVRGLDHVGENIWNIEKHKSEAAVQLPRTHSLENGTERGDQAGQSSGSKLQAGEAGGNSAIAPPNDGGRETANQEPDPAGSISHRNRRSFERGHRPKLLVPVDATSDCRKAVHYASRRAARIDGHLVLLRVIEPCLPGLLGVREIMQGEALQHAKKLLQSYAALAQNVGGVLPQTVIRQGDQVREVLNLIATDEDIAILVVAAGTNRAPGELIAELARTVGTYPVPIVIVPAHLTDEELDALS
jgi:nucleotide-binding universal stress UspA family protein